MCVRHVNVHVAHVSASIFSKLVITGVAAGGESPTLMVMCACTERSVCMGVLCHIHVHAAHVSASILVTGESSPVWLPVVSHHYRSHACSR